VLLTPIHTNLGLLKSSGKAMSKTSSKFPNVSDAKIKRGALVGPKLRRGIFDENFEVNLNSTELAVWKFFKSLSFDFLGQK
jgi:hypothetical protein